MSIENVRDALPRSDRTLIKNSVPEWKRLRSFRTLAFLMSRRAIDMQVLTDLKSPVLASPNDSCTWLGEGQALSLRPARGSP